MYYFTILYTVYKIDILNVLIMSKISNEELGILAYQKVKEMILSKELRPGDKIVQEKLALDLGISRTPLRSALYKLESEYLVKAVPRRGVYVRLFTDEEMLDIFDCRIALECMAIELLVERASPREIAKLRNCFSKFRIPPTVPVSSYQKADIIFHDKIIEFSANSFLSQVYRRSHLLACIDRIGLIREPQETLPEHISIIRAVEQRNSRAASSLLRLHLQKSRDIIADRIVKKRAL